MRLLISFDTFQFKIENLWGKKMGKKCQLWFCKLYPASRLPSYDSWNICAESVCVQTVVLRLVTLFIWYRGGCLLTDEWLILRKTIALKRKRSKMHSEDVNNNCIAHFLLISVSSAASAERKESCLFYIGVFSAWWNEVSHGVLIKITVRSCYVGELWSLVVL